MKPGSLFFLFLENGKIPNNSRLDVDDLKIIHPNYLDLKELFKKAEEVKDPRFIFGYGMSFLNDNLEDFLSCYEGKENDEYMMDWLDTQVDNYLSQMTEM